MSIPRPMITPSRDLWLSRYLLWLPRYFLWAFRDLDLQLSPNLYCYPIVRSSRDFLWLSWDRDLWASRYLCYYYPEIIPIPMSIPRLPMVIPRPTETWPMTIPISLMIPTETYFTILLWDCPETYRDSMVIPGPTVIPIPILWTGIYLANLPFLLTGNAFEPASLFSTAYETKVSILRIKPRGWYSLASSWAGWLAGTALAGIAGWMGWLDEMAGWLTGT